MCGSHILSDRLFGVCSCSPPQVWPDVPASLHQGLSFLHCCWPQGACSALWHKHKPGRVTGFHPGAPLTSGPWEPAPLFRVPGGGAFDCSPESPARLSISGHRGSWLSNSLLGWLSFLPFVRLPLDILPLLFPGIPFQNKLSVPKPCSRAFSRPQLRPGLDKLSTPRQVGKTHISTSVAQLLPYLILGTRLHT